MRKHYFPSSPPEDNPRKVTRHFLSAADKEAIDALLQQNYDAVAIATKLHHQPRQIKEYIARKVKSQENKFSFEDDQKLIMLYQQGITKESRLVKYFPDKTSWMIRNRLKLLRRRNQLESSAPTLIFKKPEEQTEPELAISNMIQNQTIDLNEELRNQDPVPKTFSPKNEDFTLESAAIHPKIQLYSVDTARLQLVRIF
ncbi:hypothetical protein TVAG_452300 [Trichomonas vaginalis G3]|uniref:Uncharacterized protein n=1 Tax=Trichomonas vaginalis (strain ATCC PRA-98 / G3) TaxID=412133 RepID=A2DJV2_TRIV3|nr:hypothetical protein TVAGG3_0290320 [Trichomonas vaginalis G3]EAY19316.1 hypothetical protein TVAG_452300 [Trichomonas vaginalis G3]KAI5527216.1 hypothetical protein TVAGG3_0290320 [Trichomonas vaginalis G3]|eukprot:XP_001580302.1 hypothetical protein [Trichomonas vaginalis G3]